MGRGNNDRPRDGFAEVFGARRGTAQEEAPYVLGEDDMVFEAAVEGRPIQGRRLSAIDAPLESNVGLVLLFDGKPFGCVWVDRKRSASNAKLFYSTQNQLVADEGTTDEWLNEVLPVIHRLRHQALDIGVGTEIWANASLGKVRAFC